VAVNATNGAGSIGMLELAGRDNLAGKVLLDVANPLDSSEGMPPSLFVSNTDPLGEQIQRAFPEAKVVKALNTMNCQVMVDPAKVPGAHDVFVCGDDDDAKRQVTELLQSFGWPTERIRDLGGISFRSRYRDVPSALAPSLGRARHRLLQHRGGARRDVRAYATLGQVDGPPLAAV
jgi:predicted dinucleotide-binding enzyme